MALVQDFVLCTRCYWTNVIIMCGYPPLTHLQRTVRQDAVLPLKNPIKGCNGDEMHEVFIPGGTEVYVSVLCSNRNPEVWGVDAHLWKPERWLQPLPSTVADARIPGVYSNMLTFAGGSRACIGFKFSQLEMKVVLSVLVETFHFAPSTKEIFWRMHVISNPNTDPVGVNPTLPLEVSLATA